MFEQCTYTFIAPFVHTMHLESYTPGLWRYVLVHTCMYRYVRMYSTYQYVLFENFV